MTTLTLFPEKLAVLAALRERTAIASVEALKKCRFRVEPHAGGWAVVSVSTQRMHGRCTYHKDAVQYAEKLEKAVDKREATTSVVKGFADRMFRWALIISVAMLGLALWGAR